MKNLLLFSSSKNKHVGIFQRLLLIPAIVLGMFSESFSQTPGGVSTNLRVWFKANDGPSTTTEGGAVSSWADKSGLGFNIAQATASRQPKYHAKAMNFNPVVRFNLSSIGNLLSNSILPATTNPVSIVAMSICNRATSGYNTVVSFGGSLDYPSDQIYNGTFRTYVDGTLPIFSDHPEPMAFKHTITYSNHANLAGSAGVRRLGFNGLGNMQTPNITNGDFPAGGVSDQFSLGAEKSDNTAEDFLGDIPEVIVYNKVLTNPELQKIQSYLAVKYGVTMDNLTDYHSSAGSVIWTKSTTYGNNVFGIAKDDGSGLNQKQSKSINTGFQPIISTMTFAETNATNTTSLTADQSFEMSGSNAGAASFGTSYAFSGMSHRIDRIWKIQETGTVGTVKVAVAKNDLGGINQHLLHSADASFDNSDTKIAMTLETIGGVEYYTATIDFANGDYYTFGAYVTAPGCVAAGLDFWLDPAKNVTKTGTTVTGWNDADGNGNNPALTQPTATLQPSFSDGDALSNFNPYVNFVDNKRLNQDVTGANYSTNNTTFGVVNQYATKGSYSHFIRFSSASNSDAGTHNWGLGYSDLSSVKVALHYITGPFAGVSPGNVYNRLNANRTLTLNMPTLYSASLNTTTGATAIGQNGNETYATGLSAGSFVPYNSLTVGGGNSYGMNDNKTQEIIHYSRELNVQERQRIQTYLAIKYGITLDKDDNNAAITEGDYILGDGTTKAWDKAASTTYHNNVLGIGRDDCQGLHQKQSKSVTSTIITAGIDNQIATTNAAHTGGLANDKAFVMMGDNNLTGWTSATFTGPCYVPEGLDNVMNRKWKTTETGDAESVRIQVPLSTFTGNIGTTRPIYMIIASDEALTTDRVSVPGVISGSVVNFDYNFPANASRYYTFSGSNPVVACATCEGDPQYVSPGDAFGFGCNTPKKLNNEILGVAATGGNADITADFKVTFPAGVKEYYQQCRPRKYGKWLQLVRYDNVVGAAGEVVFTTTFNKGSKPSFDIASIDNYVRQQDEIEIIGYCGGVVVPNSVKTSLLYPSSSWYGSRYGTVDPTVTGGLARTKYGYYAGAFWKYGTLHVEFTKNVDKIEVKWRKKSKKYNWKYYQYLYISPMNLECPFVPSCTNEEQIFANVTTDKPNYSTCDTASVYLKLRNLGCGPKTINLSNILPSGVKYVDSSLVMDAIVAAGGTAGTVNTYGNSGTLNITGITLPVGEFTIPIQVASAASVNSTVQATFQISGGSSGQSDNSSAAGCQATPLVFTYEAPPVLPTIKIKKDRLCYEANTEVNYTVEITNATAANLTPINLEMLLGADFKIVSSSLLYSNSTLASSPNFASNASEEEGLVQLDNLIVPAGISTIKFKAMANTSDTTAVMTVNVTGDMTSACGATSEKTYTSSLPIGCGCEIIGDDICLGNKTLNWVTYSPFEWWQWGTRTKTFTQGDQQMKVTITDGGSPAAMYIPAWYPVSLGNYLYLPRYDNQPTAKITTKIELLDSSNPALKKPAQKVDFKLKDIDGWVWGRDVVNVYGKIGGVTVNPKITTNQFTRVTVSGVTEVKAATNLPWNRTVYADAYINFESPVDEIYIEYTKENTLVPTWRKFNDLAIGHINLTCKVSQPEVVSPDNLYLYKEVSPNPSRQGEEFTYKFTFQNTNCESKTVNLTDMLPANLTWIDSTLATSLTIGTKNSYGGTANLNLTGISVPTGTSYIYIEAKSSAAGTFDNQASYTVNGNTYLSDEPSLAGATNPTPITILAAQKANLEISKAVNKSAIPESDEVTYTFSLKNNESQEMTVVFDDILDKNATYVAGSLSAFTGASAATTPLVSAYAGEGAITIRDITIPAAGTVSFTIKADANATAVNDTIRNAAKITVDASELGTYLQSTYTSNTVITKVIACSAGTAAPIITQTTANNTCPATTANLATMTNTGTAPSGTHLIWSTKKAPTLLSDTLTNLNVGSGKYYALYVDKTNTCFSTTADSVTVTVTSCTGIPSLVAPPSQSANTNENKSGDAAAELAPSGGTPGYTYSNGSSDPACVAPVGATALPASSNLVVNANGTYTYTAPATQ